MYQILRPISCHLSNAVQKKPDPSFLYIFPQIFLFNFSCVARSTSPLAHVQYPDASLSLSLSNSLLKLAYNNSSHIQTHTHIYRHRHIEFIHHVAPAMLQSSGELISLCCQFTHSLIL